MRILQIHTRYLLAGGEDAIADAEADLLEAGGHEVDRVRVRNPGRRTQALAGLAVSPSNPSARRRFAAIAAERRPDVAHVHNTWYALSPSILSALHESGVPIVMEMQNFRQLCPSGTLFRDGHACTECVGTHPWRGVLHRCYRDSLVASTAVAATISLARRRGTWAAVDRFVAPSYAVRDVFLEAGYDGDQIEVKPTVVADPGPREEPPSASKTVLYVGRLSPEKGPATLIEAWGRAGIDDLELLVVGDGPLRHELERDAPAGVTFAGWVEPGDLQQLMLSARALAFPSQCFETFGRSIAEAFAAGLPVLASDLAGPGELAGQLGERWVVAPADGAGWSERLAGLLVDDFVDEAGMQARALYDENYNLEVGLQRLENIYRGLLN